MIHGHMDLQRFDARGLNKEEIQAGIEAMGLDRFLKKIHKNGHWKGPNRILAALARCLYYANGTATTEGGWLNAPNPGDEYNESSRPLLSVLLFSTTSTEPAVNEWWTADAGGFNPPNYISPWKRFDSDGVVSVEVFKEPSGKEAVVIRQKFMWFPGQATSSQIRSVEVFGSNTELSGPWPEDGYYNGFTRIARWRIKDSGGNPVTLTKLDQEVLLLSYSLIMYTK